MKNLTITASILLLSISIYAQQEKKVDSKISGVTVFLNKAQITREVKTRIEAGKINLVLSGLTSRIDQQSIQVTGKGSFIIMGIGHQQNYLDEMSMPRSLKVLKDSIELLQRQLVLENSQKEILNREEQMLLSNQKIGGTSQNLTAAELKAMAEFYRSRLGDIVISRMKKDENIAKLNYQIARLQHQLSSQNELHSRNTSEIVVSLSAESATAVDLEVSYIVPGAGWYPVYDLRAVNTKSPVTLSYKANVYQGTGEDWKNVKLKLSTANPSLGGSKPELTPWYLNFYEYVERKMRQGADRDAMKKTAPAAVGRAEEVISEGPSESTADYVTAVQTTLNTEFLISLPYTVSSSNKPTLVDIRNHELTADYIYSVAPKLDADAFLLARATGWEELSLLPGEANIFFEGTFVGKSYIDPNSIRDTLNISLGRDKRIVVKREKLKDLSSKKLIGTNQRAAYAFEISVRNTKNENVKIIVEDQIPVSQNSQIEVTMTDKGGANFDSIHGKLSWELNLKPNDTQKVVYKYEIKYPKDRTIAGLE